MRQTDGRIHHINGLEELELLKWPYYPRQSAVSVQSPSKYQGYFHRTKTNNLKFCMETEKIANITILRKKSNTEGIMLPDFRLYYKAAVIKQYDTDTKTDT